MFPNFDVKLKELFGLELSVGKDYILRDDSDGLGPHLYLTDGSTPLTREQVRTLIEETLSS